MANTSHVHRVLRCLLSPISTRLETLVASLLPSMQQMDFTFMPQKFQDSINSLVGATTPCGSIQMLLTIKRMIL